MSGFLLKTLAHTSPNLITTPITLITAPAGHIYMIKEASVYIAKGGAGAFAFHLEISDTAGANFKRVTDQFTTPAPNANYFINLTPPNVILQEVNALGADPHVGGAGAPSQLSSIKNKILEPGQILRYVVDTAGAAGGTANFNINGVDYTI